MPGKGKRLHPAKRGSVGWAARMRNDEADTGAGHVYVLTGMGGLAGDLTKSGHTRNHPSLRAESIIRSDLSKHWADEREIRAKRRGNPPQLWASPATDRVRAAAEIHRQLVEWYFAQADRMADLATILRIMGEVTGNPAVTYPLVAPPDIRISKTR